jgi:hypothetical protein
MSIKIRKYEGGEVFDLPVDYIIEGEKNNPLFENKGSQTVPISFPTTVKNNRLLKFPFRIDRSGRQEGTTGVIVETGSVQQRGLLSVNSAGRKTVSANIGFDESEMYAEFKEMQLKDIPGLPVVEFGGNNIDQKVDSMLSHLTAVMKQQVETEYYIFPLILHVEEVGQEGNAVEYYEILNDIDTPDDPYNPPNGKIADLKSLSNRTIIRYENSGEIEFQVPKGYGVSPFLKVYRILELIFAHYGFQTSENPFKDHRQLKKLVVLNNTMDAVMTGTLQYKALMPDITIQEFLEGLYAKFGMLYFLDSNTRTVRIKFLKDILSLENPEYIDFNKFKTDDLSIAFSPPKQLRLKMNREIEATKTLYETYEEFLDKFSGQFDELGSGSQSPNGLVSQQFNRIDSKYLIFNVFDPAAKSIYSSDFFDWDKKTADIDYEDIEMKDMCIPLIHARQLIYMLLYDVGFKHLYSEIVVSGQTRENIENPAKLAFAFGWGLTSRNYGYNYFFASQFNRDANGNFMMDSSGKKYDISLTCNREDGLFNRFWKEYDAFLRHSNQEVTCNLHLSDLDIINMKLDRKVILDNQPLLLKQIKYKLNRPGNISECILRTLRLFTPNNITEEQSIAKYERQKYYWAFSSSTDIPEPEPAPGVFMSWERIDSGYYTLSDGTQIPKSHLSFLPPTEEEFINQTERYYRYITVYNESIDPIIVTTTVVYHPAEVIYPD